MAATCRPDGRIVARRPAGGYYFDPVNPPLRDIAAPADVARFQRTIYGFDWPGFADESDTALRQRAQAMLTQLSQEKNLLYQKVGSFRAVSNHLEQLERQLRSSMPQHVMDMLGQQAAYLSQ